MQEIHPKPKAPPPKIWRTFNTFAFFFPQDADQVERLNESGELRQMLKPYKVP